MANQINVSIPKELDVRLKKRFHDKQEVLRRMGIQRYAQMVAAVLENGLDQFDRNVEATEKAIINGQEKA